MQSSYRDTMEKFSGKKRDTTNRSIHKKDRQFRDSRKNRHAE